MLCWLDSQAGFLQMLTDITPGLSSYKIVTSAERELLPPPPLNIPETTHKATDSGRLPRLHMAEKVAFCLRMNSKHGGN